MKSSPRSLVLAFLLLPLVPLAFLFHSFVYALPASAGPAAVPYLQIFPDVIVRGETITAYGEDFCVLDGCGPVKLSIASYGYVPGSDLPPEGQLISDSVPLDSKGKFEYSFRVVESTGPYRITAAQAMPKGVNSMSAPLLIGTADSFGKDEEEGTGGLVAPPAPKTAEPLTAGTVNEFQPNIAWAGRTVAVDINPDHTEMAIAASESGGLFITGNTGRTWTHVDTFPTVSINDVKYAPGNASIVLATASPNTRVANLGGIWRSADGGSHWSSSSVPLPTGCSARYSAWSIAFAKGTNDVFVGTSCGVAISHDLGAHWTHVQPVSGPADPAVHNIAAQRGGSSGAIVDVFVDGHHVRSTNGGGAWSAPDTGFTDGINYNVFAISPLESDVLFIIGAHGTSDCDNNPSTPPDVTFSVFESDDAGRNWNPVISDFCALSRPMSLATHISSDGHRDSNGHPDHMDIYVSDGGQTFYKATCPKPTSGRRCNASAWTSTSLRDAPAHADANMLAFSTASGNNCPQFLSSDGGILRTTDCGAHWAVTGGGSGGFNALQIYDVLTQVHPDHTDLYFGTQDNSVWGSSDNGLTWPHNVGAEGFLLQVPHSSPTDSGQTVTGRTCFGCSNFSRSDHLVTDLGWTDPPDSIFAPILVEPGVYLQFAGVSPAPNQQLYIGHSGVWTPVTGTVVTRSLVGHRFFLSGPASDPTLYVGIHKPGNVAGLIKITGLRTASATIAPADTGLGNLGELPGGSWIWQPAFGVDPNNPQHLIAADVSNNKMKYSTTGGADWHDDDALTELVTQHGRYKFIDDRNFPTARSVQWNPVDSNQILVGTDEAGVIASYDGGQHWGRIAGSERVLFANYFAFDEVLRRTIAASYGRGLWILDSGVADLRVSKTGPGVFTGQIPFNLTVRNDGPAAAESVTVKDEITTGTTFVSLTSPAGWTCTTPPVGNRGEVRCTKPTMANGESAAFTLRVAVDANVGSGSELCDTATVGSDIADVRFGNNSSRACATVVRELVVDRSDDADEEACTSAPDDCTLRGAINFLNLHGGNSIPIRFHPSIAVVHLVAALPTITAQGISVEGSNGVPIIDGTAMGKGGDAFKINASDVTIRGLSIVNVADATTGKYADIRLLGGSRTNILENYLGTLPPAPGVTNCAPTASGVAVTRNALYGIRVESGVGGTAADGQGAAYISNNTIGCHGDSGILLFGADFVRIGKDRGGGVHGNRIGRNSQDVPIPNSDGVALIANGGNGAQRNLITENMIQSNNGQGIHLVGTGANNAGSTTSNTITGNKIDGNGRDGIALENRSFKNTIGGLSESTRNVIYGNEGNGVLITGSNENQVLSNYIGVLSDGITSKGNSGNGVLISASSSNQVGNVSPLGIPEGNLISGNGGDGVQITGPSQGNKIVGNTIGADADGATKLPNAGNGVAILGGANHNTVGGGTSGMGNIVGGNLKAGILLAGKNTTKNTISGNEIGARLTETTLKPRKGSGKGPAPAGPSLLDLGNGGDGIRIQDRSSANLVDHANLIALNRANGVMLTGGATTNGFAGNEIANNAFYGLLLDGTNTAHNRVSTGSIHDNGTAGSGYDGIGERSGAGQNRWTQVSFYDNAGLAVDKGASSDTTNNPTLPYPIITENTLNTLRGTATPNADVEVYVAAPDPSGFGEGRRYLGHVTADARGKWLFRTDIGAGCFTALQYSSETSSEFGNTFCPGAQ